jgi:hypothetical protein
LLGFLNEGHGTIVGDLLKFGSKEPIVEIHISEELLIHLPGENEDLVP